MKLEVRKLKNLRTRRGLAYTCELYVDGTFAASCENEGHGGATVCRFSDPELKQRAQAWCATQSRSTFGETFQHDIASYVDMLCDEYESRQKTEQKFRRICKTKVLFRTPTTPVGEWLCLHTPYTTKAREFVLAKYPEAEIYNDRLSALSDDAAASGRPGSVG